MLRVFFLFALVCHCVCLPQLIFLPLEIFKNVIKNKLNAIFQCPQERPTLVLNAAHEKAFINWRCVGGIANSPFPDGLQLNSLIC